MTRTPAGAPHPASGHLLPPRRGEARTALRRLRSRRRAFAWLLLAYPVWSIGYAAANPSPTC
ncbi:MAG: hypothetical protein AAGJ97_11300, partial [Planctomycetota bacterium]